MSTYRELIYMVMDKLKISSDDAYPNEKHISFLLDKYRNFLLKQDNKSDSEFTDSNYQTLCIPLIEVPAIVGEACESGVYLRSKDKIPSLLNKGITNIQPEDYFGSIHIQYVDKHRFRFTRRTPGSYWKTPREIVMPLRLFIWRKGFWIPRCCCDTVWSWCRKIRDWYFLCAV